MGGYKWSRKEVEQLKALYPFARTDLTEVFKDRTQEAIVTKANRLGLRKIRCRERQWSPAQVKFIETNYPLMATKEIATKLDVDAVRVSNLAYRLRLKKSYLKSKVK